MRSGLGLREGHLAIADQARVVVDPAFGIEHAAVPVIGELVEAQVALHDEGVPGLVDGDPSGDIQDAVRRRSLPSRWHPAPREPRTA